MGIFNRKTQSNENVNIVKAFNDSLWVSKVINSLPDYAPAVEKQYESAVNLVQNFVNKYESRLPSNRQDELINLANELLQDIKDKINGKDKRTDE